MGAVHLHHAGYGAAGGAGQRTPRQREHEVREGGPALRWRPTPCVRAASARRAQELVDHVGAARSEGGGRTHPAGGVDGRSLREREVLPKGCNRRRLPRHREDHRDSRGESRPGSAQGSLGGLAHRRYSDAEGLRALCRAFEQGRGGVGLSGYRGDVARQI